MAEACKTCGKPYLAERAGSITSYFFQNNYCRCHLAVSNSQKRPGARPDFLICSTCGMAQQEDKRVGTISAFMFKELRCTCGGKPLARTKNTFDSERGRRTAERKQFSNQATAPARELPVGTIIGGVFQLVSTIGKGGMGAVYQAKHTALDRTFALKVLLPELVNEQNWLRFKAEARTVSGLNHPTIVKVYDLGIDNNELPFYSMDYVQGETLEHLLLKTGVFTVERAINIFLQILDGLAYAHRNGIIHRDIKPANIMICQQSGVETVRILDFGLAKLSDPAQQQGLTMAGEIFGSPYYMSPEQIRGKGIDIRSDIYSVGCTFFETLTSFVPFDGDSAAEILMQHQTRTAPWLREAAPEYRFSNSLEYVVAKCLAKGADERYQSAKELAVDLERLKEDKDLSGYFHLNKQRLSFEEEYGSGEIFSFENSGDDESNKTRVLLISVALLVPVFISLAAGSIIYSSQSPRKNLESALPKKVDQSVITLASVEEEAARQDAIKVEKYLETRKGRPYAHLKKREGVDCKIFELPKHFSLGSMSFRDDSDRRVDAQGKVIVPEATVMQLNASALVTKYPQLLRYFQAGDLAALNIKDLSQASHPLPEIAHLIGLKGLSLSYLKGGFDQTDVNALDKLTTLNYLFVGGSENLIEVDALARSKVLQNLETLHFVAAEGVSPIVAALEKAQKIRTLSLNHVIVTPQDIALISQIEKLDTLSLKDSKVVTVNDLKVLTKLKALRRLYLGTVEGSRGAVLSGLKKFKTLNTLEISMTLTDTEKKDLLASLPFLTESTLIIKEPQGFDGLDN